MTAGEGPDDGFADLDLGDLEGVWATFTEDVDMARPIWLCSRKQKAALSGAALMGTRQRSVIATA
jgi:hypothetical protein